MVTTNGAKTPSIGGHFSAWMSEFDHAPPGRFGFVSARAGLAAVLKAARPARVHAPNFVCRAVKDTVDSSGAERVSYSLSTDLMPDVERLLPNDIIIIVNLFGLLLTPLLECLTRYPPEQVVVDNAQAYFQPSLPALANIYSPRKFIPVPDGGYVDTTLSLAHSGGPDDDESLDRWRYLVRRVGQPPEISRAEYLDSEESFSAPEVKMISGVTDRAIRATDQSFVRLRRRENFQVLSSLNESNKLPLKLGDQVPLTFPLMVDGGSALRRELMRRRIFCPRYWPDVVPRTNFESALVEDTVHIPIDHRYGTEDMRYVLGVIRDWRRSI